MNKKISLIVTIVISVLIMPTANAQRGCCSHHGGVAGCTSSGRQICKDGTLSPSCTCTPVAKDVYGCMDSKAKNYNEKATKDDGTCKYYTYGCTDSSAINYNSSATKSDGSCKYENLSMYEETKTEEDNDDDSSWIFGMVATITGAVIYKKVKK